jgi:hypothetical protein
MEWIVPHDASKQEIERILAAAWNQRKKGVDVKRYAGTLRTQGDPVEIQRRLRKEWN